MSKLCPKCLKTLDFLEVFKSTFVRKRQIYYLLSIYVQTHNYIVPHVHNKVFPFHFRFQDGLLDRQEFLLFIIKWVHELKVTEKEDILKHLVQVQHNTHVIGVRVKIT